MNFFLKQKKFLTSIILSLSLFSFAIPHISYAAKGGFVPCGGYDEQGKAEAPCKFSDIFVLVARLTNWLIGVAGLYAVYQIINNAFWLVLSQGNEEYLTTHKKGISNAIVGMVLVFMAFMFINFVINGILVSGMKGKKLDLTNPVCYLALTTQNECFIDAK